MLRYVSFDIVFQEIPGEVTLAINISNCLNRCKACHSPHLWENIGEELNESTLSALLATYGNAVTCVCFMGGDAAPHDVNFLAKYVHAVPDRKIKTGWYSGKPLLSKHCSLENFDFIKLGPYDETLGGLDSPNTNQRFYKINNCHLIDMTYLFQKKH